MSCLSPDDRAFFDREGYLIVEDVLSEDDLAAIEAEYEDILNREVPRLAAEGKLTETHDGLGFHERYARILPKLENMYDLYQHLDISLPLLHEMAPDATLNTGRAVFERVLTHPRILDIAESVLGPELTCSPVQHTRIKPPKAVFAGNAADSNVDRTLWHQDEAVLTPLDNIDMLTVWVAITDATTANGCMVAAPKSHKGEELMALHCPGNGFSSAEIFIPDALVGQETVPLPVGRGGVVLLHQRTIHGSLDNQTDTLRWSFDLRYYRTGQASGRDVFPSFVARSRRSPESELKDPDVYAANWIEARDRLAKRGKIAFNEQWSRYANHPMCA